MSYNREFVSQVTSKRPAPLTLEENLALIPLVQAGDKAARETMIEGNIAYVNRIVDDYIRTSPFLGYFRDDMTSAGLTGLVKAVNMVPKESAAELKTPVDYIRTSVTNEIIQAIDAESMIRIPHSTKWLSASGGTKMKPPTPSSTVSLDSLTNDDTEALFDMRDLIISCCVDDDERTFVEMREASYTMVEIAAHLGVSSATITRMKKSLYARVLEKSGLRHIKKGD